MVTVLTCKGHWTDIPDWGPVPRVGDSIQFDGFTLKAVRVLWQPTEEWSARIECNMIRQNWTGTEKDLFESAGFGVLPE